MRGPCHEMLKLVRLPEASFARLLSNAITKWQQHDTKRARQTPTGTRTAPLMEKSWQRMKTRTCAPETRPPSRDKHQDRVVPKTSSFQPNLIPLQTSRFAVTIQNRSTCTQPRPGPRTDGSVMATCENTNVRVVSRDHEPRVSSVRRVYISSKAGLCPWTCDLLRRGQGQLIRELKGTDKIAHPSMAPNSSKN